MGRHKKTYGTCRLCGVKKELTYEHVPPRAAFNKNTQFVSIDFMKYVQSEDVINNPPKGKKKQGGIGYNSLCGECNSFLGSNYVPAYVEWANVGYNIIREKSFKYVEYTAINQQPLKILKAIISMFVTINDDWYLESYPELSEFVRNPDQKNLPDRYKIFAYLTNQGGTRYMHHSISYKPSLGGVVTSSEIAYPPYGYALTIDFDRDINILNNITGYKTYNLDEKINLKLNMFNLPVDSPFTFDYRTREQISADIQKAIKYKKENS